MKRRKGVNEWPRRHPGNSFSGGGSRLADGPQWGRTRYVQEEEDSVIGTDVSPGRGKEILRSERKWEPDQLHRDLEPGVARGTKYI